MSKDAKKTNPAPKKEAEAINQEHAVAAETLANLKKKKAIDGVSHGGNYLIDEDGNLTEETSHA